MRADLSAELLCGRYSAAFEAAYDHLKVAVLWGLNRTLD